MTFDNYLKQVEIQSIFDNLIYALDDNKITSWQDPQLNNEEVEFYYDEDSDNEIIGEFLKTPISEDIVDYISEKLTTIFNESVSCKLKEDNQNIKYILVESKETGRALLLYGDSMVINN